MMKKFKSNADYGKDCETIWFDNRTEFWKYISTFMNSKNIDNVDNDIMGILDYISNEIKEGNFIVCESDDRQVVLTKIYNWH